MSVHRESAVVLLIALLVIGCTADGPTSAPVPPTATLVAVVPTDTPIPATATSEPPTGTPLPPTITLAPPTATATPKPTATLAPESTFDGVKVTFVNIAGFLITVGDKKILIDALYHGYPEGILKPVISAQPPFDGVDLILVTHEHQDHLSPELVLSHMSNNPDAILVSSQSAVDQVVARDAAIRDRVIPIQLKAGESEQMTVSGIELEAVHLSHGVPGLLNLGFIVTVEGVKLFHTGDLSPDHVTVSLLQSYGLPQKGIDVAFVPDFLLTMDEYHAHVLEGIRPTHIIPMHFPYEVPPSDIEAEFPSAIVFQDTMESWVLASTATETRMP